MTTRMTGAAVSRAPPEAVWKELAEPARMRDWFAGARDVEAGNGWPNVGGTLRWRVGPSRFEARVTEASPPHVLKLEAQTPSARSVITHVITPEAGGARIEKTVEAEWRGWAGPIFGKLVLAPSVRREARRLADAAERVGKT